MASPSVTYTFTNGNVADASQVNQNFTDLISSLTDGSKSINIDAITAAGTATLNGNTILGNDAGDTHTVTGRIVGNGAVPAGAIQPFAMATPPTGWLLCDGSAVSRTTYADLYTAIQNGWDTCRNQSTGSNYSSLIPGGTQFRVPDLRGVFLRGVGTSSGYDATTLGSTQDDATAKNGLTGSSNPTGAHTHNVFLAGSTDAAGSTYYKATQGTITNTASFLQGVTDSNGAHSHTITIGAGDSETRPVNAGVHYFIKT